MVDSLYYSGRRISKRCENSFVIAEYITESFVISYEESELTHAMYTVYYTLLSSSVVVKTSLVRWESGYA